MEKDVKVEDIAKDVKKITDEELKSIQEKVKSDDKKDKKNISDLLSDIEDGELKERISSLGRYIFNK